MQNLSLLSIGFYSLFKIFTFYQILHFKNLKGESQAFYFALGTSALLGTITSITYLIYYGWMVAWWAPIPILLIGMIAASLGSVFERLAGAFALSILAFVGWPVSAFFMFLYIPVNP